MPKETVFRPLKCSIEVPVGDSSLLLPMTADFLYDKADPFAVQLDLHDGNGPIPWDFDRTLLAEGLEHGSGEGDVYIAPDCELPNRVWISLTSPTGIAFLAFDRAELQDALHATNVLVPPGAETIDWDFEWPLLTELGGFR